jgi:hypothetical protein
MLSITTRADIYSAWCKGLAPTFVAKTLRLALSTVIKEYISLDESFVAESTTTV